MEIINILKEEWSRLKTWKRWLLGMCAITSLILLHLVFLNVIKPVYILWSAFVIFVIILLMIRGKKGIEF